MITSIEVDWLIAELQIQDSFFMKVMDCLGDEFFKIHHLPQVNLFETAIDLLGVPEDTSSEYDLNTLNPKNDDDLPVGYFCHDGLMDMWHDDDFEARLFIDECNAATKRYQDRQPKKQ